ncbi:unnamed protein product [Pedinophyceae sp. YPF-701]|nr:unnamed protein product [Pedinophyceae sp. YPF-701]
MGKAVVIDCRGHLLGRLASIIAKQVLSGQQVVCVRTEEILISGGLIRQKMKYERFLAKGHNPNPRRCGPWHFRAPARMLWRVVRGMVPHKTARGAEAMGRLKVFEGIPAPYDKVKRVVVPDALKVLRMAHGRRFCRLGDLAKEVGWKHADTVAELEAARKAKADTWWQAAKKKQAAVRTAYKQAAAQVK